MPNYVRVPKCPFYLSEQKKSVSCEDTYHSFDTEQEKVAHMEKYCCRLTWALCPYAADLSKAYEEGDDGAVDEAKMTAMKKEMKSLSTKIGKAEKKIERMQKKIDDLRAVNQSFVRMNDELQKQKQEYYRRWRELLKQKDDDEEAIRTQLNVLTTVYEQRMAYLIETYCPEGFREMDVKEWALDKKFAITAAAVDGEYVWKVVYGEDDGEGIQETDAGEAEKTEVPEPGDRD